MWYLHSSRQQEKNLPWSVNKKGNLRNKLEAIVAFLNIWFAHLDLIECDFLLIKSKKPLWMLISIAIRFYLILKFRKIWKRCKFQNDFYLNYFKNTNELHAGFEFQLIEEIKKSKFELSVPKNALKRYYFIALHSLNNTKNAINITDRNNL